MRGLVMRGLMAVALVAAPAILSLPAAAQTEGQGPAARQATADPNAPYRLAASAVGALVAAAGMALVIDGWMVEMMMTEGMTATDAAALVSDLEGEGGLEAATVALTAVIGGVLGGQAGRHFFPPAAKPASD